MDLVTLIAPEIALITAACVLFLVGVSSKAAARRVAPMIALLTLAGIFVWQLFLLADPIYQTARTDEWRSVNVGSLTLYVRMIVSGIGMLLVLLAWPTNRDATGSASLNFGHDAGEFFALMLLSLSGVSMVAAANDIILLFLAIELASIPTYIMVSISRPIPVAQEAGVKYFFLGAMAAAVMLFGFSYLYGTTGFTKLHTAGIPGATPDSIAAFFDASRGVPRGALADEPARWLLAPLTPWQVLGVVMLLAGFAFKIAAVPLHVYAGDVYQGAATPVTAFLAFVPKTTGFLAILKILFAVGGLRWAMPDLITELVIVIAILTMSIGNVLGLLQYNVKRVLAYSSIAHSGYMLVGVAALLAAPRLLGQSGSNPADIQSQALMGILFYLAAYGIMNAGAFGVLMLLPSRGPAYDTETAATSGDEPGVPMATTAETWEDLAGQGRRHPLLGLAMAVCCFSLIGLPLTVGFFGKLFLIKPALDAKLYALVIITMVNALVSAAYYLRIVATMFLRPAPEDADALGAEEAAAGPGTVASNTARVAPRPAFGRAWPIAAAVLLSVIGTLVFGTVLPAVNHLTEQGQAAKIEASPIELTPAPVAQASR